MAGLCCGEPCTVSWPILQRGAAAFVSCGDEYAARGMRLLGRPEPGDPAIVSGTVDAVIAVDPEIAVYCGAGVKTGDDVRTAMDLGAHGVLLASGVVKAKDPEAVLRDLISKI